MSGVFFSGGRPRFDTGEADGSQRFADAAGQLLQVNQLCILVGSGASFHLGSPTIRTMTSEELVQMCRSAGVELSADATEVLESLVTGTADLESLMAKLTAALTYASAFQLETIALLGSEAAAAVVTDLFESVNVALATHCRLPSPDATLVAPHDTDPWYSHREFFRRILGARRPDAPRVKVFTTNYDTVIEQTLDDSGIHYLDGFRGGIRRSFDLSGYGKDFFSRAPGTRNLLPVHELLHLYKLHGSLTWRVNQSPGGLGTLRIIQAPDAPRRGELAVIYPTPTKEGDVVGYPYADLLREFGVSLSSPECALLVVGYGFGDDHINRLIYQALSFNSTLQVLVADPFGVVPDGVEFAEEMERTATPLGKLSAIDDARISVLTGEDAAFTRLALALPDVTGGTPEERQNFEAALAEALLRHREGGEL